MIKRLLVLALLVVCMLPLSAFAQEDGTQIAYGETASGEISNRNFDATFVFDGVAGDIVIVQLTRSETADFDPLLYLTTLDNEILAQNDDYYDLNSQVVARLPEDGTYQIVATRLGERTGNGEGAFTVSLEKAQSAGAGIVLEGTAGYGEASPVHVFSPDETGIYTITYRHVSGDYFPMLSLSRQGLESGGYSEEIGQLNARGLEGGTLTLSLDAGDLFIVSLKEGYYTSATTGDDAVYTIQIDPVEAE